MKISTLKIDRFLGINQNTKSGGTVSDGEFIDSQNFRITADYRLVKRDGIRERTLKWLAPNILLGSCTGALTKDCTEKLYYTDGYKIFSYSHSSDTPYCIYNGEEKIFTGVMFIWDRSLYLLTNTGYKIYDGDTFKTTEGYCPKILINAMAHGPGTPYEDINLLSSLRCMEFTTDGESSVYRLPERDIDEVLEVIINNVTQPQIGYYINLSLGLVSLIGVPQAGLTMYVKWRKSSPQNLAKITSFTNCMFFGGANDVTLFLWGGNENPALRRFSYPGNPEYFPESGYSLIGAGARPITNIVRQFDRQIIFTDKEIYYSVLDSSNPQNIAFPVFTLNSDIGCSTKNTVSIINNSPVFISSGMVYELVSTNIRDERNVRAIGDKVATLISNLNTEDIVTYDYQERGEYYIVSQGMAVVYNYKANIWYKYTGIYAKQFFTLCGDLYFLDEQGGIYQFVEEQPYDISRDGKKTSLYCYARLAPIDFGAKDRVKYASYLQISANKASQHTISLSTNESDPIVFYEISVPYTGDFFSRKYKIVSLRFNYLNLSITDVSEQSTIINGIYLSSTTI